MTITIVESVLKYLKLDSMEEEQPQPSRHKWEQLNVRPVAIPVSSYGECKKVRCHNVGELGNGICQKCWDRGAEGKSRESKQSLELPTIHIDTEEASLTWDIPKHLPNIIVSTEGG